MDRRPNFIVIHCDQMRGDCLGITHQRQELYTPNLNSMAYQGARFSSAYSTCPICIPQRLSLLTGQKAEHHGVMDNLGIPYLPMETNLPAEMGRGGYQTAMVGRTMHTYPYTHPYGFEYYKPGDLTSDKKDADSFYQYLREQLPADTADYLANGTALNSRVAAPFHLEDRFHHTTWTTNRALEFLDKRDPSRPFMLFVGYMAPHTPLNPPSEYFHRYYDRNQVDAPYIADYDVKPVSNGGVTSCYVDLKGEELRAAQAGYYGSISYMDTQIGRILDRLVWMPNTYVIFTADHGEMLGDHYCMHKSRSWQGSVHIPFLIYGPGIRGNQVFDQPVTWYDIMPTILDLVGLPIPESVDGESLAGLLHSKEGAEKQLRKYVHGECLHLDYRRYGGYETQQTENNPVCEAGSHYVTDGKMKYIWYQPSGREQLFDLEKDYGEQHDLAKDPAYAEEMKLWRERLVQELQERPEGFVKDGALVPGTKTMRLQPNAAAVYEQRRHEYLPIAYDRPFFFPMTKDYINNLR